MPRREIVVDGDGHVCEPSDLWTTRLPAHLRERGIRLRWNAETGFDEAYFEDRLITDRGLVGLGNAGTSFENLGQGIHYEDIAPAGFDPRARLRVLDAEGIDAAVLYPGLGLSLGAIDDRELGLHGAFARPNPPRGVALHDPVFTPVWEALEELQVPIAFHPAGLWDMPGTSQSMAHLMAPATHHALRLYGVEGG